MLTIGEFSKICLVTKKTLRHYDEIGLLKPEHTADNGYRYYNVSQLKVMLLIGKLKAYGFSLPEIAVALNQEDPDLLADQIEAKRRAMESSLAEQKRVLELMERDCQLLRRRVDIMEHKFDVKIAQLEPVILYSHRKVMSVRDFDEGFGALFAGVGRCGHQVAGPVYTFYHDDEFNQEASDMELAVEVAKEGEGTRTLEGGSYAFATHIGDFDDTFRSIYAAITEWMDENGYEIDGAPFDKYIRGMGEEENRDNFVTEVYFPIRKKQGK